MNHFPLHIGDYAEATGHLTFVEDSAYLRCIRKYYSTEKPLPTDIKAVQRLVGARSKDELQAVETVLNEFFALADDGWHNARCDAELAIYFEKSEKAKASANSRWKSSSSNANAMRTHTECNAPNDANAYQTQCEGNANQEPITKNQEPNIKPKKAAPSDSVFDEAWLLYPKRPGASKAESLKAWTARVKAGVDRTVMLEGVKRYSAYCKAVIEDPSFIKQPATFFGPNEHYLSDWTLPDQPKAMKKEDKSWMFSDAGIEAKAQELGISATGYDTYETLKEKCRKRIVEKAVA